MKSLDELISRFKDIQDLPVSEEMLGAYFEGNLDSHEMARITKLVQENDLMQMISEEMICSPKHYGHSGDLLNAEMEDKDSLPEAIHNSSIDANCDMLYPEEQVESCECYTDENENTENNDLIEGSTADDSSFELPGIPYFFDTM